MSRYWILLIFSALTINSLFGSDASQYESTFLILTESVEEESQSPIRRLVFDFIQVSLVNEGIPQVLLPDTVSVSSAYGEEDPRELLVEYLAYLGSTAGADFVLLCRIEESSSGTQLSFSWISTEHASLIASVEKNLTQLRLMDIVIVDAIRKLLDSEPNRLVISSSPDSADFSANASGSDSSSELSETTSPWNQKSERPSNILVSARFGLIQVMGESNDLFSPGLMPSIGASYGLPTQIGAFNLGLFLGLCSIEAQSSDSTVENLLVPIGPQIGFSAQPTNFLEVDLLISGGASLFGANADQKGYLFKFIPFANATAAISFFPGSHFGLGISLSFVAFFEDTLPIFGYVTSAGISVR